MNRDPLPGLVEGGHVVVATAYYPPQVSGSSVIMQNLLSCFDPASYSVATAQSPHRHALEAGSEQAEVVEVASSVRLSYRVNEWWREAQIPLMRRRMESLIRRKRASLVVGVYPDYHFLLAGLDAAGRCGIPFVAYLHDTIAEAMEGTALQEKTRVLQDRVFAESARVLVMSQGMADLYRRKYGLEAIPVVHTYPESVPEQVSGVPLERQGFWGGSIYRINMRGLKRVADAFGRMGVPFVLATDRSRSELRDFGLEGDHLELTFYSKRQAYLDALPRQGILVQALDWPDECETHEDEMATIFPTKTPEYLAAGVPMLVHCPEHYYLARFVREHGCGLVVSERNPEGLEEAIRRLLADSDEVEDLRRAALRTARMFGAGAVSEHVQQALAAVATCHAVR